MAATDATKKCPKCSESIQADAQKCKHCGSDLRSWFVRHKVLTGLLALLLILILPGLFAGDPPTSDSSTTTVPTPVAAEKITATQLYSAYDQNAIAADAAYKDKHLEVSGTIGNIGKDILDDMYVALKTSNIIGSVQCMLKDSEFSKAVNLREGQQITIVGRNSGKLVNIILRDCIIL